VGRPSAKVWERFPNETEAPWAAFVAFREMTKPRNLNELAERLGYAPQTLHGWSHANAWSDRVAHYDAHLDRKRTKAAERANERAGERLARKQLEAAEAALDVANRSLKDLRKSPHPGDVNAHQAARLLRDGTFVSRLVLGEVTDRPEVKVDLSKLSDKELAEYDRLTRKASGLE
jgi:hypothetical protein